MTTSPEAEVNAKREELKKLYPKSASWQYRVHKMSAAQVTAIYLRFKAQGKLV